MAAVHKGGKTLSGQARRFLFDSAACLSLFVAFEWVALQSGAGKLYPALYLLPTIWLGGVFYYYRKYKLFRAGATGEAQVLKEVRGLPRRYHVFTNFLMREDGMRDEADFVVVGENGVFVIEVKHHGGKIVGAPGDARWAQHRAGKRKAMRNPVGQTARHAANLMRLLRSRGRRVYVRGVLVFTNPRVRLEIERGGLAVLRGGGKVNDFILRGKPRLDWDAVDEIVAYLKADC